MSTINTPYDMAATTLTNIHRFRVVLNVVTMLICSLALLEPSRYLAESDGSLLFGCALTVLIICIAEIALTWYLSDETFSNDICSELQVPKDVFVGISISIRLSTSIFLVVAAISLSCKILWILFACFLSDVFTRLVYHLQTGVERVRAKRLLK